MRNMGGRNSTPFQNEKFRRATKVTTKLASLASEATGKTFKSRIALLENIASEWRNN